MNRACPRPNAAMPRGRRNRGHAPVDDFVYNHDANPPWRRGRLGVLQHDPFPQADTDTGRQVIDRARDAFWDNHRATIATVRRNERRIHRFFFNLFWCLWLVPGALEAVAWCVWCAFASLAEGCHRISEWFRKQSLPLPSNTWSSPETGAMFQDVLNAMLENRRRHHPHAPPPNEVMFVRRSDIPRMVDEGHIDEPPLPRAPRTAESIVFGIHDTQKVRRLVREMGEHLEEHSEKGFVRDGAYDQLYRDLMAIRAATLPDELNPHPN